jgi:Glyoxalase-like domain
MIDHLVIATPDVGATAADILRDWGVRLETGGSHSGRGTRNELTGLGGATYLEVIGPDDAQAKPPFARPMGVDDATEARLVGWCARPHIPLADAVEVLEMLGFPVTPISAMDRRRPDGVLLSWHLTFPFVGHPHHGSVPFLIDWGASPHPATTLAHPARLVALNITHPHAPRLHAALSQLGDTSQMRIRQGEPGLTAEVLTPNGVVTL